MKQDNAETSFPPDNLPRKPKRLRALLLVFLVGVCGLWLGSRWQGKRQAEETASILAEHRRNGPCGVERVGPSLKSLAELTERWRDELLVAGTVPRFAMGGPFAELLRTRRELEDLEVAPCLAVARRYREEEMEASISLFRGVMADSLGSAVVFQTAAAGARRESDQRILAVREKLHPEEVAKEIAKERAALAKAERERLTREAEQVEALQRRAEAQEETTRTEARIDEEASRQELALREISAEEGQREQEEREREIEAAAQRDREEIRRRNEEMRRRNEEVARRNRIAREEKMASWGVAYAEHIQPVKAALQEILRASQVKESVTLLKACGRLHTAVGELKASPAGRVPDSAAQAQFQSVLNRLDRVGESCALKSTTAISIAMEDLEGALKGLSETLRPYNLSA